VTSVVIAAHNEQQTIRRCLDSVLDDAGDRFEVVVAANGCTDRTVSAATRPGVVVLDLAEAGKAAALNAAEQEVTSFPRVYLDADSQLTGRDIQRLVAALGRDGAAPLAVTAGRIVDTTGRPFVVRQYHRMLDRHPAFVHALYGRGVVVLSEEGRARFDRFPALLGDDFFLDSIFADSEKQVVADVTSVVAAPSSTRILLRRLGRVRRGNREVRDRRRIAASSGAVARPVQGWGWLVDTVRAHPSLAPSAAIYASVTVHAVASSRLSRTSWGHDQGRRPPLAGTRVDHV
jgi:glycosyltransferase involved in cell wall biosynthesis